MSLRKKKCILLSLFFVFVSFPFGMFGMGTAFQTAKALVSGFCSLAARFLDASYDDKNNIKKMVDDSDLSEKNQNSCLEEEQEGECSDDGFNQAIDILRENERKNAVTEFAKYPRKEIVIGKNKIECHFVEQDGKEIAQLSVLDQTQKNGGGDASCGYHCIKNGCALAQALSQTELPDKIEDIVQSDELNRKSRELYLAGRLQDSGEVEKLFANLESDWRKKIVFQRLDARLKRNLGFLWQHRLKSVDQIDNQESDLQKEKVQNFLRSSLTDFASKVSRDVIENESASFSDLEEFVSFLRDDRLGKISPNDIWEYFKEEYEGPHTLDELAKRLCNQEVLKKYLEIEDFPFVSSNSFPNLLHETESMISAKSSNGSDGEWLDDVELRALIKKEQTDGMLRGIENITCFVCEDVDLITNKELGNLAGLLDAARKTIDDPNHKVIFCLGNMQHESEARQSGTSGHWYPVVWSHDRSYTMDSKYNTCRLQDNRILKVLHEFEKARAVCALAKGTTKTFFPQVFAENKTDLLLYEGQ